jgi:hypothetical protein
MHSAGARAVREDDNQMSREAVLLQWERKIEAAERLDAAAQEHGAADDAQAVQLPAEEADQPEQPRKRRFERGPADGSTPAVGASRHAAPEPVDTPASSTAPVAVAAEAPAALSAQGASASPHAGASSPQAVAERRTITITGRPTPPRRRRAVVDSQLAQPDRIALWAFLLGLLLVAVAAGTAHA